MRTKPQRSSHPTCATFQYEGDTLFSEVAKSTLLTAVGRTVEQRRAFLATLVDEGESVTAHRRDQEELLDEHDDDVSASMWYRGDFEERLDEIAAARQETIRRRNPSQSTDRPNLYREHDWTYPVLTAVAWFRTATV